MADFNSEALLRQMYEANQTEKQGLRGRLDRIDQFAAEANPYFDQIASEQMKDLPTGVMPMDMIIGNFNNQMGRNQNYDQVNTAMGQNTQSLQNIIQLLQGQEETAYNKEVDQVSQLKDQLGLQDGDAYSPIRDKSGKLTGIKAKTGAGGEDASRWFISQYGKDAYWKLAATEKDRKVVAETIYDDTQDGYDVNLNDLLPQSKKDIREKATILMNSASDIYGQVTDQYGGSKNAVGVGLLGGRLAPFGRGADLRSKITGVTADKIKELSGAAVSDMEVKRLSGMLPQVGDSEQAIATKTKTISTSIKIGLELQEKAVRENLTLDQAYEKYGAELYEANGEQVPDWLKSKGSASFEILSDDEIREALKD